LRIGEIIGEVGEIIVNLGEIPLKIGEIIPNLGDIPLKLGEIPRLFPGNTAPSIPKQAKTTTKKEEVPQPLPFV
jgi:hypothetical protein